MEKFDFISGEEFRKSLENDYKELTDCLKVNAWKASHVLAGSIIETLLIDFLVASDYKSVDPLKMDLGQAIAACKKEGILTEKTEQLSSAIKSYRNLIHPGRKIRLGEEVDENGAKVAQALVDIVIKEVAARRKANYGYTAEQIVSKLERDSSAIAIIEHILKETNRAELERLLIIVVPKRYSDLDREEFVPTNVLHALAHCFRAAFGIVDEEIKRKVMKKFVSILKEADEEIVLSYETAFLKVSDFKYLSSPDVTIVKRHLLSRLSKTTVSLFQALKGIGAYLAIDETENFVDSVVKSILAEEDKISSRAREFLIKEYSNTKSNVRKAVIERLNDWIPHLEEQKLKAEADNIRHIKATLEF
ncbi:MAG TPA: hypothetical protein ENN18_04300 [Proteobacteria bacterium]|nr:hypothetical protein [Pseudomonadota bacterium]